MCIFHATNFFIGSGIKWGKKLSDMNGQKWYKEGYNTNYPTSQNNIEPSEPPLANRPSCIGCHARQLTSFLWPRNVCISFVIFRIS